MNLGDGTLTAFATAAGVSPDKMSLFIRTVLLTLTFIWAAWCVHGQFQSFKHHDVETDEMMRKYSRVFLIVTAMMILVFVS
jgi:integrating conjugative element protein (TIGR03758 family)